MPGLPAAGDVAAGLRVTLRERLARIDLPHLVSWTALALVACGLLAVTGLGARGGADPAPAAAPTTPASYAVAEPGRLRAPVREPALLVVARRDPGPRLARSVRRTAGVAVAEPVGVASLLLSGRTVTAASVEPATYRRLSPTGTAEAEEIWDAVARGDAAVSHGVAEGLALDLGGTVPTGDGGHPLRLGAFASTVPGIDVVVNRPRGSLLGLPERNAAVVSLRDDADAAEVARQLRRRLGRAATVTDLAAGADAAGGGLLAATLVGGDVADAVGSFSYRWFPDGTVAPDPAWVGAHLVTGEVPILGTVTCHRVMLPQLHAALTELQARGLARTIDPGDFGGCYSPRFIERDPTRGLSLHTWGIAVDLNVSGNQVGTVGTIDPRVVEVFDRWGFAWGGRWRVPDPMHFELARLVAAPPVG